MTLHHFQKSKYFSPLHFQMFQSQADSRVTIYPDLYNEVYM